MADKTVRIRLDIDGTQASVTLNKVNSTLDKQVEIVKEINKQETIYQQYERVSNELIAKKNGLLKELITKVTSLSNNTKLNDALALNAATASAEKYNRELSKIIAKQNDLRIATSGIGSLTGSGYKEARPSNINVDRDRIVNVITGEVQSLSNLQRLEQEKLRQIQNQEAEFLRTRTNFVNQLAAFARRPIQQPHFTDLISGLSSAGRPHLQNIEASRRLVEGLSAVNRQVQITNPNIQANSNLIRQNTDNLQQSVTVHRSLATHIAEIIGIYRFYNAILNAVTNSIRAIPRIGIELESTQASLTATSGGFLGMEAAMENLRTEAERTGIAIGILRENFRTFQASTSLAGESANTTWKIFTNLNTVITGLHLSADRATGIFNAIAQIFNKSKVQSEELVKQLGNLIPGAFASFAAATGKSTLQLSQDMKKGLVLAHDTIDEFTTFLAARFGIAFDSARDGLNASIGRMQSSFTYLGEAIYGTVRGPLKEFINSITNLNGFLVETINGTNNISLILKTGLNIALSYAAIQLVKVVTQFGLLRAAIIGTTLTLAGLETAFAFITSPVAIIAGIGAIILHFRDLQSEARVVSESIAKDFAAILGRTNVLGTVKNQAQELSIKIDEDPSVKAKTLEIETLTKEIAKLETINKRIPGFSKLATTDNQILFQKKQDLAKAEINLQQVTEDALIRIQTQNQEKQTQVVTENEKLRRDVQLESLSHIKTEQAIAQKAALQFYDQNEKKFNELQSLIDAGKSETATKEIKQQANEATKDIELLRKAQFATIEEAIDAFNKPLKTKALKESNKEIKGFYQDTGREIKIITADTKAYLAELATNYEDNKISIKDYYDTKRKLELQAIADEKTAYEQGLKLAFRNKDKNKVAEYQDKITQSESKAKEVLAQYNRQEIVDNRNLLQILEEINIEYLKLTGNVEQAGLKQFDLQNKAKNDLLKANSNSPGVKEAQERQELNRRHEQYVNRLLTSTDRQKIANDTLANEELRLNTNRNAGLESQLDFMIKIEEARKKAVKTLEAELALDQESARRNNASPAELQDLENRRAALQALRQDAEVTANFMRTTFSEAFSNNFSDFILGTKSASEAFRSFGQSILKTIADIAAQQLAKSLIGLALNVFGSALGAAGSSSGGGIVSGGGNLSGQIGGFLGGGKLAQGGVSSNPRLSQLSGTILNKPTIIPFAKGGTFALAGEAGHEAIMPLTRDSNGKLGVKAINNSTTNGGNVFYINVQVTSSDKDSADQTGQKVAVEIMKSIARKEVLESKRVANNITKVG